MISWSEKSKKIAAGFVLFLSALLLYAPKQLLQGQKILYGIDYLVLHSSRLDYARQFLLQNGVLPGWYTREFFGTPFWSNLHSLSWLPNHLALLFLNPTFAFGPAVVLAAFLASWFMYLFARSLNLSHVAAIVCGWTFIAAGFFSSRVMAGQLLVLEAYFALPLLLWLIEKVAQKQTVATLVCLMLAVCFFCLAGHPQIPIYSLGTTFLYIFYRRKSLRLKVVFPVILLGIGLSSFIWVPMLHLILNSSRSLAVSTPINDISYPWSRMLSFVLPWHDGWPPVILKFPKQPFGGYPSDAYFWDTFNYVGWAPLVAILVVSVNWVFTEDRKGPWMFFLIVGLFALLTSTTTAVQLLKASHGILIRSAARQLYVTVFALSLLMGYFVDLLQHNENLKKELRWALVLLLLVGHGFDLTSHARYFVRLIPADMLPVQNLENIVKAELDDGRVAMDTTLPIRMNRKYDDVGYWDPLSLAAPFRFVRAWAQTSMANDEGLSGVSWTPSLLSNLGVRFILTFADRSDLKRRSLVGGVSLYEVPNPQRRVSFVSSENITVSNDHGIMVNPADRSVVAVSYQRLSPDQIRISLQAPSDGYLQILESWYDGWSASVNATPVAIDHLNGFAMAIPVVTGTNNIDLIFRTPWAIIGIIISIAVLLCSILFLTATKDIAH